MKKLMMLLLAMTMVLALAACGMDKPVETAVPTDLPMETETMPEMTDDLMEMETPEVETERSDVADTLDAIRDYDPENLDAAVMRYAAAAKVLTFCKNTERSAAQLKEDVRTYFAGMSDDEKADFSRRYEDVADLASRIAAGDVEQSAPDQTWISTPPTRWTLPTTSSRIWTPPSAMQSNKNRCSQNDCT